MKKVLLLSLGLVMGLGAFAQTRVAKDDVTFKKATAVKKVVDNDMRIGSVMDNTSRSNNSVVANRYLSFEEAEVMATFYDLQSNAAVSNRMYQNANGDVAVVATYSDEKNLQASDRGTGYNFAAGGDMSSWGYPEGREEANATGEDFRTGWPTIAPYGENGEILVAHPGDAAHEGLYYWIRETAGEGQWDGPHSIPNPTFGDYPWSLSWARVTTSGPNNDIIHVACAAQHQVSSEETHAAQFYCRSTDGVNWEVNYSPLAETNEHIDVYGGDDYAIASWGDVVAIVYSTTFQADIVAYKSVDNGLTWERMTVWENPFPGDWSTDASSLTGTTSEDDPAHCPTHVTVAVGPDGTVHVAFSVAYYAHIELGTSFYYYKGRTVDGILYWNDTREPVVIVDLWGPDYEQDESGEYVFHSMDSINYCGWLPFYETVGEFTSDYLYEGDDYIYTFYGACSGFPALSVDPEGNLALAYSTLDTDRIHNGFYLRSTAMSYKAAGEEGWNVAVEHVMEDFMHSVDEAMFVNAAPKVANVNEFWFSYTADNVQGLAWGTGATQSLPEANLCYVFKISSEYVGVEEQAAKDVVYNVYPNPASDYIFVASSMNADATVTFTNIAGQTVKVVNTNLTTGENSVSINDLNSGVYFCTVTANGYSHTSKVVVK